MPENRCAHNSAEHKIAEVVAFVLNEAESIAHRRSVTKRLASFLQIKPAFVGSWFLAGDRLTCLSARVGELCLSRGLDWMASEVPSLCCFVILLFCRSVFLLLFCYSLILHSVRKSLLKAQMFFQPASPVLLPAVRRGGTPVGMATSGKLSSRKRVAKT